MTTARVDILTIASAVDKDGESTPLVLAYGSGNTVANVAADGELLAVDSANDRKVMVHAVGGAIWLGINKTSASEPRGLVPSGASVPVKVLAGQTLRVSAAALS